MGPRETELRRAVAGGDAALVLDAASAWGHGRAQLADVDAQLEAAKRYVETNFGAETRPAVIAAFERAQANVRKRVEQMQQADQALRLAAGQYARADITLAQLGSMPTTSLA